MKIYDGKYEIKVVVANFNNGIVEDIYEDFSEFKKKHPFCPYKYGYIVVDTKTGFVPDDCNDWNDSIKEALNNVTNHYINHYKKNTLNSIGENYE